MFRASNVPVQRADYDNWMLALYPSTARCNRLLDHMAMPREVSATVGCGSNKQVSRSMPGQNCRANLATSLSIHAQES